MPHSFPTRRSSDLDAHRADLLARLIIPQAARGGVDLDMADPGAGQDARAIHVDAQPGDVPFGQARRSEEHTSELQSLMRISYAVFCLEKKKNKHQQYNN